MVEHTDLIQVMKGGGGGGGGGKNEDGGGDGGGDKLLLAPVSFLSFNLFSLFSW